MPGTEFIGAALLGAVRGNYDRRIEQLRGEVNKLLSSRVSERHFEWRVEAEGSVMRLASRVEDATDAELTGFKIESPPRPDDFKYRIRALENQIESLSREKEKALAYVGALAATEGVVTLSAADLRRIGYQP